MADPSNDPTRRGLTRRRFLATTASAAVAPAFGPDLARAAADSIDRKASCRERV